MQKYARWKVISVLLLGNTSHQDYAPGETLLSQKACTVVCYHLPECLG